MDRDRAVYALRLLMGCGPYFDRALLERISMLRNVMAQVMAAPSSMRLYGLPTVKTIQDVGAIMASGCGKAGRA